MSEQQSLHHPTLFNATASSRPPDPSLMSMPYYPARLDGVAPNMVPINSNYFGCYNRPQESMPPYLIRPQLYFQIPQPVQEAQMANHIPNTGHTEFQHMNVPTNTYHSLLPLAQNQAPQQMQMRAPTPQVHQSVPFIHAAKSRPKNRLVITNPRTGNAVELDESESRQTAASVDVQSTIERNALGLQSSTEQRAVLLPFPPNADESPPSAVQESVPECAKPEATLTDPVSAVEVPVKSDLPAEVLHSDTSDADVNEAEEQVIDEPDENKTPGGDFHTTAQLLDDSDDDSEDSEAEEAAYRRMYSRAMLLNLKDSPVAQIPLAALATLDNLLCRKGNRATRRSGAQRVIRLPASITVKRVEGAFVPSQLRKKTDMDEQKMLSRELNVILNRVSDGNISETITDIKKLELSTSKDIHLLAEIVFQKSIRQSKYSKVFASLCKELKGFEVQGSTSFECMIIQQVQELFNTPLDTLITELNAAIDAKIAAAKDDAVKRMLEDDRETNILKKTEAYHGNVTLLGELYLCRLVSIKTLTECLKKLKEANTPEAVTSLLILLQKCGADLDQNSKGIVDSCFGRLNSLMKGNKLAIHQVYKVQELCDLRDRKWKEINRTQAPVPVQDNARRPTDDKPRWSTVPHEIKRRPNHSALSVTPSSLAVTQQSYDSRKLCPPHSNWSQGSGPNRKLPQDENSLNPSHPKPGQSLINNRSREASPRVSSGLQGVWAARHAGVPAQKAEPQEDYGDVLERNRKTARACLVRLQSGGEEVCEEVNQCKAGDRPALLHALFDLLVEKSSKLRNTAGQMCVQLLEKKLITPDNLVLACKHFFQTCDDDWLCEYPMGWRYLAEMFECLIHEERDYFQLLLSILKQLHGNGYDAEVLAHCLRLSSDRLGKPYVANKFQAHKLCWSKFGVQLSKINDFTEKHSVSFTLTSNSFDMKLKELAELTEKPSTTQEQLLSFFRELATLDMPDGFVQSCTRTMISKSEGLSRQHIDRIVFGFGILVNHIPERESQVLNGLQSCKNLTSSEQWRNSLLEKKVISCDAFDSWAKSAGATDLMSKTFPARDK